MPRPLQLIRREMLMAASEESFSFPLEQQPRKVKPVPRANCHQNVKRFRQKERQARSTDAL
jgi:hypothetical protein